MTITQKNAAAGLALAFILAVTSWLLLLLSNSGGAMLGDADDECIRNLTLLWSSFKWMVDEGQESQKIFAGFLAIIGIGTRILANRNWFRGQTYLVIVIGVVGITACTILLIVFWDMDQETFRNFDDNTERNGLQLRNSIGLFLSLLIGWYVTFLELQLGITASILRSLNRRLSQSRERS